MKIYENIKIYGRHLGCERKYLQGNEKYE